MSEPIKVSLSDADPRHPVPFFLRARQFLKRALRDYGLRASWSISFPEDVVDPQGKEEGK